MLKALAALAILFLASGCMTTYSDADGEPAAPSLMGMRCEVTKTTLLPRAEWHWFKFDNGLDAPATIEVEKGTTLRVVHLERINNPFLGCASVLAVVENGPQTGSRVVIGRVEPDEHPIYYGDIWLSNHYEGLSAETGRLLRPIDPIPWRNVKMIHEEEGRPGPTLDEVRIRSALNRQERN